MRFLAGNMWDLYTSGSLTAVTKKLVKCCETHEVRRKNSATEQLVVLHFFGDGDIKQRLVTATFLTTEIITAGRDVGLVMERRIPRK
jgi:hypothetical protein